MTEIGALIFLVGLAVGIRVGVWIERRDADAEADYLNPVSR